MGGLKFGPVVLKFSGARLKSAPENLSFWGLCLILGPGWEVWTWGGLKFGRGVLKFTGVKLK